jgi:hypothetical protein
MGIMRSCSKRVLLERFVVPLNRNKIMVHLELIGEADHSLLGSVLLILPVQHLRHLAISVWYGVRRSEYTVLLGLYMTPLGLVKMKFLCVVEG